MIFGKNKNAQAEQLLDEIFGSYKADVLVVKDDGCEILYMSEGAKARLKPARDDMRLCNKGFSNVMPDLCAYCSKGDSGDGNAVFDVTDENDHIYSVTRCKVSGFDAKSAKMFIMRDVTRERADQKRLYSLAYIDQLTGVPNRQRFKEDFNEIAEAIEKGRISGLVGIFDLDNFKTINDTYGHNAGDAMLKRLAEHLSRDEDFRGHIYRLGGDEFVMLYYEKSGQYQSQSELQKHYGRLLNKALLSYTMPNIEDQCTLSIGVALFPTHGESASELLRKADIALYQAKSSGKNQYVFFEEQYDKAKKFKDLYINIAPILFKTGRTFGYELMDGTGDKKEADNAINLSEFDRTLAALGLSDIESNAKYFIAFTKQLFNKTVLKNLPKEKFVIQLHASRQCTPNEILLYRQLGSYGYSLALSGVTDGNLDRQLLELCDYCKLDVNKTSGSLQISLINQFSKKTFIATGVSSQEDYECAQRRGFKLYQGYFFQQEVVTKKTKDIDPLKINYFRLMQLTSTDIYVDFQEISSIIASDVAMSYKLLKLLNSAAVGLRSRMSSISMAVAYLGEENLKKWIALLALQGISADKPLELVRLSLIRARFGELLAPQLRPRRDPRHVFLTGMLSLLHIALDISKEELLEQIPVADDIRDSLSGKDGAYSDILNFFRHYEYSNWEEITRFSETNGISCSAISEAYIEAVRWCNELINAN